MIERFQKSSCSEIARPPLKDWSSVTSPTSGVIDPGRVAAAGRPSSGAAVFWTSRATAPAEAAPAASRASPSTTGVPRRGRREASTAIGGHQPDGGGDHH